MAITANGIIINKRSITSIDDTTLLNTIKNGETFLAANTKTLYFKYSSSELVELCTTEELSTVVGPQGEVGPQGLPGIKGDPGPKGKDGIDGKDALLINTNGNTPLKLWVGSQEELDLIIPRDNTTIYMVEEGL